MRRASLKTKTALFVLLVFFTTAPTAVYLTLEFFGRSLRDVVNTHQVTLLARIGAEIDEKLQGSHDALINIARLATADDVASPESARRFLHRYPLLAAFFDNGVFMFTPDGILLAETNQGLQRTGLDFSAREYIRQTRTSERPYISRPFVSSQPHHHPTVMFTAPVFTPNGTLVAILGGSMDLLKGNFIGSLASTRIGKGGHFYLFADDGVLIMHPQRENILQQNVSSEVLNHASSVPRGGVISAETVSDGTPMLSTLKKLSQTTWTLAADLPKEEAYAPLRMAERSAWAAIIPWGLLSVAAIWLLMRRLTLPILALECQIREAEDSGAHRNVLIRSGDEIERVAEAFNGLVNRLIEKEDRLVHLSNHDSLTGLYNRLFFEAEMQRIDRGRHFPVSMVMVDVDNLKTVNDTFGHTAGDALIIKAAQALRAAFRSEDVVARVGGDEFAVIMEGSDHETALDALERVRETVALLNSDGDSPELTLSLGTATATAPLTLGQSWRLADQRMYADKARRKASKVIGSGSASRDSAVSAS
ncbi:GGDEF domain-containing protein [Geobacter sulfurreducens]|uniref:sensor domain-containing diguanylate cyclase n=1 Tax=Geobacter sulfurreducens TaxID=35554 RepID=UPI000DBB952A|nr:GGDEF domain-containing protein [Geobacter sulfurreducens]BBA71777.1 putative diguanylate cyclase AdrA [Geobacter sulfurreducens]